MSPAVWYWREGETQHGPVTWEKLQAMAESGKVAANDWVFREGWADWKLACEAKDSSVEPTPPVPEPPPLPLPAQPQIVPATVPPAVVAAVPLPNTSAAPHVRFEPVPVAVSAALPLPLPPGTALPMPLPPLAPQETVGDVGPMPPSPDGVTDGDVNQLRRVLRDGPEPEQSVGQFNPLAAGALAAALVGLLFLAFEMGLLALGLGGWCLYASSVNGNASGRGVALAAVAVGAVNVVFRVLCATMDLGLGHL